MRIITEEELNELNKQLHEYGVSKIGSVEEYEKIIDAWNSIGCTSFERLNSFIEKDSFK